MRQGQEQWTLYSKSDKVYRVKRLISNDTGYLLLTYEINASLPEQAHQTLIDKQKISGGALDKTKTDNSSFDWQPFKATPILFVQLQYSFFKDQMTALNKRPQLEHLIDEELRSKILGQWIAGDIGPGGACLKYKILRELKQLS